MDGVFEFGFRLRGLTPLLMHNERMANPIHPAAKRLKALTGKRKKTDDDFEDISRAEFDGGLYISGGGPYIPDHWLMAMLRDGAKTLRLGRAVTQGVFVQDSEFPLFSDDRKIPKTADKLWAGGFFDQRMVGNQRARVLRTRPRFDDWSIEGTFFVDSSVFDHRQIEQILDICGKKMGIGDYRPRFGRFEVVS